MNKYYIGVDLSTNIIGWAIVRNNKKEFICAADFSLKKWSCELNEIKENHTLLYHMVMKMKNEIELNEKEDIYEVEIGIELSNFSSAKITQRFAKYFGIIETYMLLVFRKKITNIKGFNANEWFKFLIPELNIPFSLNQLVRDERKRYAKNFLNLKTKLVVTSEDIADAFCIAYFCQSCRATETIESEYNEKDALETRIGKYKRNIKKELLKQKIEQNKKSEQRIKHYTKMLEKYEKELGDKYGNK